MPIAPPHELVTVVIPAFNRVDMLRRAIASALTQTHEHLEVLVVDDGSTPSMAMQLADITDPRLKIVRHQTNRGASAARNTGIACAAGAFVAFLDSDDQWLPMSVTRQLACFASANAETVMVYGGVRVIPPVKPVRMPVRGGDLSQVLAVRNAIGTTSAIMVRRSALQAIGGFDEGLPSCQDWDLYIRLAKLGPIEAVPEVLVIYRVHKNSITGSPRLSVAGHRLLRQKHAASIAALPSTLRAEHEIHLAELFLWKRAWRDAAGCLISAVRADPRIWAKAMNRLVARKIWRLLRRTSRQLLWRRQGG